MSVTPLMNMTLPTVGVTSGTDGNNMYVTAFNVVDGHDHTSGKGTQIPSAGININSNLSFASFSQTNVRSTNFSSQGAVFSSSSDNNSCYVVNGDLYFRSGGGSNVQITNGASVAGTSGSIGSLASPASASFDIISNTTFIWKSDATTFAKMRHSDIELYPATSGASKKLTMKVDSNINSNLDYSITWPATLPGAGYFSTDGSGNLSSVSGDTIGQSMTSIGANAIGSAMTSTGANAVANSITSTGTSSIVATATSANANTLVAKVTRATGTTVSAGGIAISNSSGSFTTASSSAVDVTNLSVTITTSGRPVCVRLIGDSISSYIEVSGSGTNGNGFISIVRDASTLSNIQLLNGVGAGATQLRVPPGCIEHIDAVAAGTYTYKIQARYSGAAFTTVGVQSCKLVAYEL